MESGLRKERVTNFETREFCGVRINRGEKSVALQEKPESKSFLAKAGIEMRKQNPAGNGLGFFYVKATGFLTRTAAALGRYSWLSYADYLGGLYLVTGFGYQSRTPALKSMNVKVLLLSFSAAVAWTIGAVILKLVVGTGNAVVAAAVRVFSGAAVLTVFQYGSRAANRQSFSKDVRWKTLLLMIVSGTLGYGVGGITYVAAMQRVGAGRTVLISSLTPVFILILSVLFLKEKSTPQSLIGTLICVLGVVFLSV